MYRVVPSHTQNFALLFTSFYKISVNPKLNFLKDSLGSSFTVSYTGPCQLVLITDLLRVYFVSSSRSLVKTMNNAGLSAHSWSTPLLFSGWQPNTKLLCLVSSQFSVLLAVHLFRLPNDHIVGVGVTSLTKTEYFYKCCSNLKTSEENLYLEINIGFFFFFGYCNLAFRCLKIAIRIYA